MPARGVAFYRAALRSDPKNTELLDRAFISSLADGDIEEAVRLAERILAVDKNNRVARLVVRRAATEAEAICRRATQHQSVGARADHGSRRDAAVGLGDVRLGQCASCGRQYRQARRTGMVSDLQGSPRRHDSRSRQQAEGRRCAFRARLQARRFRAARGGRLCALADAQQGCGGGDRHLSGVRQEACASSAGRGRYPRNQGRQEIADAGRIRRSRALPKRSMASAHR